MSQIAAEKNSTIIFPLPVDFMLSSSVSGGPGGGGARGSGGSEVTFCKSPDGVASSGLGSAAGTLHHPAQHGHQPQQQQQQQQLVINVEDLEEFTLPPPPYR